ncbi:general secretion pathway protein I [Thiogranum longum]|uniref:Type II secretion system protein I n=1 Tax=Thiogranum longum TaxID=1537524 RepID=A0A4R1HG78_9GAMM|nr:type II secretion system minor pseudopilin GspI [Thiogranum longum]TCK19405.1 general secretion pathway protein I [Thiogranum longum]
MNRMHGFTLLEILVALLVVSLSMGAVVQTVGSYTRNQANLRDRVFAQWVARNQLASVQIAGDWPSVGQKKGDTDFPEDAGGSKSREWRWVMQVTQSPEEDMRRLDIDVFRADADDDAEPIARLSGFVEKR